jgi:hypothetical protein
MKRNIRTSFCLVLFGIIALYLAGCGGGSPGDGTTPGPTGPKPEVVYGDNASVCGSAVTVTAQVDPKGSANYHFVLTDNRGGRQVSSTAAINGTGYQLVQASFTGLNPLAANTVTVEATNANGTTSDFGSFPTWTTPPAVTGMTAINITRSSGEIVVTVDPSLDPTLTEVVVRYGADATGMVYTQRSWPAPASLDNLVFSLSGYTDNTTVYFWLATTHTWGSWVSETARDFTTLPWSNTVTVTGAFRGINTVYAIILDGRVADRINSNDGMSFVRSYNNVRNVQFEADYDIANPLRVSYTINSTDDKNVFSFVGDGTINLGTSISILPGQAFINITGSGYTAFKESPGMVNFTWQDVWTITEADSPPGAPQVGDNVTGQGTYVQNPATPNYVETTVAGFPTLKCSMNGRTFYCAGFWWPNNEYIAWGTLNAAGNRIEGWAYQSWYDSNVGKQYHISGPLEETK